MPRRPRKRYEPWEMVRVEFRWPREKATMIAKTPDLPIQIRNAIRRYLDRYPTPASIQRQKEFASRFFTIRGGDNATEGDADE